MTTFYPFAYPALLSSAQVPSVITALNPTGLNPVGTPAATAPFIFSPTLDGTQYSVSVTWGLFGQRYYVNCYTLSGILVFSVPLVGSPSGILLQSISWRSGTVFATDSIPSTFKVGSVVEATIIGNSPDAYNGTFMVNVTGSKSFTYPLSNNPGPATALGSVEYNINMAAGYFNSSLVYRSKNQQFEVSP
jgi:hypothetical protein